MRTLLIFFLFAWGLAAYELSNVAIEIPETTENIDPFELREVDADWFDQQVMPQIMDLKLYSYKRQRWIPIPYDKIENNCFARRFAVDSFLWFGEKLKAVKINEYGKKLYLLPGFTRSDFKERSWIETGRINVVGKLKTANGVSWSNHEAVVVNSSIGVRVIDPSFSDKLLSLDEWFAFFAPAGRCQWGTAQLLRDINMQLVWTVRFKKPWDESVPDCGYVFRQRLDSRDIITATAGYQGSEEEIFLSARTFHYFEHIF